jgi:hypothetical protein
VVGTKPRRPEPAGCGIQSPRQFAVSSNIVLCGSLEATMALPFPVLTADEAAEMIRRN